MKFLTLKFELKCLNLIPPELQSTIRIIYLHKNNIKYPPCKKCKIIPTLPDSKSLLCSTYNKQNNLFTLNYANQPPPTPLKKPQKFSIKLDILDFFSPGGNLE